MRQAGFSRFIAFGPMKNRRTVVADVNVGTAAALVSSGVPVGQVVNVTDTTIHTLAEIVDAIARAAGRNRRRRSRSRQSAPPCDWWPRSAIGVPLPDADTLVAKYFEDVAVRSERVQSELGFRPALDLAAACARMVRPG